MERQLPNLFANGANPFTKDAEKAHTQDMADFYMVCMQALNVSESSARNIAETVTDADDSADEFCCKFLDGHVTNFVADIREPRHALNSICWVVILPCGSAVLLGTGHA